MIQMARECANTLPPHIDLWRINMPAKSVYQDKPPYITVGQKFNLLTIIGQGPRIPHGRNGRSTIATWECVCECGVRTSVTKSALTSERTKSCGCFRAGNARRMGIGKRTHGKSPEYRTWQMMRQRCQNPNDDHYHNYGARGIIVCTRWNESFLAFLADMGSRPIGRTIDRLDVNGNYEPGNCRWATATEQTNNKRNNRVVEFRGERKTVAEWARFIGMNPASLMSRLSSPKWTTEMALTIPLFKQYHKTRTEN